MKILIMSVTAGEGHNSTAKAVEAEFASRGIESQVLDTYKYVSEVLGDTIQNGYLATTKSAKFFYSNFYKIAEKRHQNSNTQSAMRLSNSVISKKVLKHIDEYAPDAIVFTHPFIGVLLDYLKQKGLVSVPVLGIVTDFTMHPYWEEALYTDYVIIANELLAHAAQLKGFRRDQILPLGIPIHPKFSKIEPALAVRARLGLDPDKLTLLVMGGSMGYGHMEKTISELDAVEQDFQMIIVCGNNSRAKEKIDALKLTKKAVVYGFVNNVDELMDAASAIVTKPGGLTTSEALAKRLPMIICNPIPGHEMRNTEFLINAGAATAVSTTMDMSETVFRLFVQPERIPLMEKCADLIRRPNATRDICDFIEKLIKKE